MNNFTLNGKVVGETIDSEPDTSVWWNIDDCGVPEDCEVHAIAKNIRCEIFKHGYYGRVFISAYGKQIPQSLKRVGIKLNDIPLDLNTDEELMKDLEAWVKDNPSPANILLIPGKLAILGKDFRKRGYTILFAQPYDTSLTGAIAHQETCTNLLTGPVGSGENTREETTLAEWATSVWWDIEDLRVPQHCDCYEIAENIKSALSKLGYQGPVSISAYGDTSYIPESALRAFTSTGISLNHVPNGGNDKNINELLLHMMSWVVHNPAPANILFVSGKKSALADAALRDLGERYNILLSASFPAVAKTVWHWTSLLAGGSPIGCSGEDTHEEGALAAVKTFVCWNMEDCKVPQYCDCSAIAKNIESALSKLGYQGPVNISAYRYSTSYIPDSVSSAFTSAGISLKVVSNGEIGKYIIGDMLYWHFENPCPSNILLISGDKVFYPILSFLGEVHNILLSASLSAAAKTVWYWSSLLAGGSPIGCGGESTGVARPGNDNVKSKTVWCWISLLPRGSPIGPVGRRGRRARRGRRSFF